VRTIRLNRVAALGGAVSLLVTGFWVARGPRSEPHGPTLVLWLLEAAILLVLIFLSVRTAPPRRAIAGGLPAAVALSVSLLRFGSLNVQVATGCCVWGLSAVAAALVGGYLRALDTGRHRAVEQARLQQRLALAGDLHDFVAHDVSEILAQAQAAQILAGTEPGRLPLALERITTAAVRALDTLDRTVSGTLEECPPAGGAEAGPLDPIDDVALLVNRFQSSGTVRVDLQLHHEAVAALSQQAGREVYRAVVEALTNVRRHAADAQQVRILLRPATAPGQVELSVTDDAPHVAAAATGSVHTGLGLASLSARIRELGGTIWAGPGTPTGWRLCVTLPARTMGTAATWSRSR
jgi:signal transduction histidine kinase